MPMRKTKGGYKIPSVKSSTKKAPKKVKVAVNVRPKKY